MRTTFDKKANEARDRIRVALTLAILFALWVGSASRASAQIFQSTPYTWNGSTSTWTNAADWSGAPGSYGDPGYPTYYGGNVLLPGNPSGSYTVTYDVPYPSYFYNGNTLDIEGYSDFDTTTLSLNSATALAAQAEDIATADNGIAEFDQSNGTNQTNVLSLGAGYFSTLDYLYPGGTGIGIYKLSGGGVGAGIVDISNGSFVQTGGGILLSGSNSFLYVNSNTEIPGSTASYSLQGGTLEAQVELIGNMPTSVFAIPINSFGQGTFTQSSGTNTFNVGLFLYGGEGYNNYYKLEGGVLTGASGAPEIINGAFTQSGTSSNTVTGTYVEVGASYDLESGTLSTQDLQIDGGGSFTQNGGSVTATGNLELGTINEDSGTASYTQSTGTLSAANEYIGYTSTSGSMPGIFTQTGGSNTISGSLYVGDGANAGGDYKLNGLGTLSATNEYIGYAGVGTLEQSTDIFSSTSNTLSGSLYLGYSASGNGSYTLGNGGSLSAANEYIGYGQALFGVGSASGPGGIGSFTQTGGTNTITGTLDLATGNDSTGSYTQSGGTLSAGTEYVGDAGGGTFLQSAGTNTLTGNLYLGNTATGEGSYSLSGSGKLSAVSEYVGYDGTGAFVQAQGPLATTTNTVGGNLYLGYGGGSSGSYDLQGGTLTAPNEEVGYAGAIFGPGGSPAATGTFTQEGGSNEIAGQLVLATGIGSTGVYAMSGGLLSAPNEYVGSLGSGTFTQTGGSNEISSGLVLGYSGSADGTYVLNNSVTAATLTATNEYIGYNGTGSFTQSGGVTTSFNEVANVLYVGYGNTGSYELDGGTLEAGEEDIGYNSAGSFTQTGGNNFLDENTNRYTLYVGYNSGGSGTYALNGGQIQANGENIGYGGTGTFVQSIQSGDSTNAISGELVVGGVNSDRVLGAFAGSGYYELEGGELTAQTEYIGFGGTGSFTQTAGSNEVAGSLFLGFEAYAAYQYESFDGTGAYTLSQTGTLTAANEYANYNSGFTQSGNTLNQISGELVLGDIEGGSYELDGGTLSAATEILGYDFGGTGSITQTGGTNQVGNLFVGGGSDSNGNSTDGSGVYTLKGTGTITATNEYVGFLYVVAGSPSGSFTQSGSSVNIVTGTLNVGGGVTTGIFGQTLNETGYGTYEEDGGYIKASAEVIGYNGYGTFTQDGGSMNVVRDASNSYGDLILGGGASAGFTGTYTLDGEYTSLFAGNEIVGASRDGGYYGTLGVFNQKSGSNDTENLYIGGGVDKSSTTYYGAGTYSMTGDAYLQTVNEYVGYNGPGTFTQNGPGTNKLFGDLYVGNQPNYTGTSGEYDLQSGVLEANDEYIGSANGQGTFNQTGGSNTVSGELLIASSEGAGPNKYQLSPASGATATLEAMDEEVGEGASFVQIGGLNTVDQSLVVGGGNGSYNGGAEYLFSSGTINLTAGSETIGEDGSQGLLDQTGGVNEAAAGKVDIGGNGTYVLTAGTLSTSTVAGNFLTEVGGQFEMDGSSAVENGYLQNYGTFTYYAGTYNGVLENDGTVTLNASLEAHGGIINNTLISVPAGFSLYGDNNSSDGNTSGIGLDNEGELDIANSTVGGTGFLNDGLVSGYGTINGTNFTNYGVVEQGAGSLTLSATGTNTNYANIDLASGYQFRLTGGKLINGGTLNLNGGIVTGTAKLDNSVGGVITGPGSILGTFANDIGGTVQSNAGTINIAQQFTNAGLISLTSPTANITGAGIENVGTIQGVGNVGSTSVTNDGIIEAIGGTLGLNGTLTNPSDGQILAGSGGKVLVSNGLATNAGLINVTGGTYDNNGHAISNTGEITGYGTFRSSALTSSGTVTLAGGNSTVNGTVTETGGKIDTYNPTTFTSLVSVNGGVFTTHETQTVFAGGLAIGAGTFNNDPGTVETSSLTVAAGGSLTGGSDSLYKVSGNVSNSSTHFQLAQGGLELVAPGTGTHDAHTVTWTVDTHVEDIGTFTIDSGQTVDFENGGNGNAVLAVLSFQLAAGLGAANPTALQADINADLSGDLTIYYDPNTSSDSYLDDKTYTFGDGGVLEAEVVPEPGTWAMFLVGLGMLIGVQRLRRRA